MVKKTENMALEETRSVLHDLEIQKKSIKKQLECGNIEMYLENLTNLKD